MGTDLLIFKDHLGSVSALTDSNGALIVRNGVEQVFSYDAWGQRRQATNWLAYSDSGGTSGPLRTTPETKQGYTGHEMLDEVGLVHMNGRIYDASIGRFLSADPHVQASENSQNYNRYAYVLNNPLSYTDPSGYFFKKLFKAIAKILSPIWKVFKKIGKWIKENWRHATSFADGRLPRPPVARRTSGRSFAAQRSLTRCKRPHASRKSRRAVPYSRTRQHHGSNGRWLWLHKSPFLSGASSVLSPVFLRLPSFERIRVAIFR